MKHIKRKCLHCNSNFLAPIKEVKRGNGRFCSIKCGALYNGAKRPKSKPNTTCAFCDKAFYKSPSKLKNSRSGLHFCCRKHKDAAQRLGGIEEIMPPHYGTSNGKQTYRKLALENMPNLCNRCGYDHFVQALVVHHIDHDRNNNDLSNLEILCPTCHWEHHLGLV